MGRMQTGSKIETYLSCFWVDQMAWNKNRIVLSVVIIKVRFKWWSVEVISQKYSISSRLKCVYIWEDAVLHRNYIFSTDCFTK